MTDQPLTASATPHGGTRWHVFLALLVAAVVTAVGAVPYLTTFATALAADTTAPAPDPLLILIVTLVQNLGTATVMGGLGLWLGPRIGLGAPDVQAWLAGDPGARHRWRTWLVRSLVLGSVIALVAISVDLIVTPFISTPAPALTAPAWQAVLLAFHAGINEEVFFRLGCLTLLAWGGCTLFRRRHPSPALLWGANVITAGLFTAAHLPQAVDLFGPSSAIMVYAVVVNGTGGLILGWLYWRHGLLAAITAHSAADILLYAAWPLLAN